MAYKGFLCQWYTVSTTNTQGEPLLGFFEIAVSRDYVIGAWAEFREGSEGWDDISFDPESGAVVSVGMSEDHGLSFHELTFFDWFSRRVRHESNVFLARFGDALASADSSHAAAKLLADVDDRIGRLKKESLRMGEETAHRVFTTWLTRIEQDAEDIASDDQSRRDSRGATPLASLADQDEIVDWLLRLSLNQSVGTRGPGRPLGRM